jgi:hypothetical protein
MQIFYCHQSDEIASAPVLHIEETEWTSHVAPVWFSLRAPSPWQFEQNESPTLETALVFDEWQNPVRPQFVYAVPQVITADDIFIAAQPTIALEEDWNVKPAPVAFYPAPRVYSDDEVWTPTPPCFDEDFWTNPVAPVFAYAVRVFWDDDFIFPQPPARDEDYWQNAAAPVAVSNFLRAPDVDELPGFFFVASPLDVVGVGSISPVAGAGSTATSTGAGNVGIATGLGKVN